ncbi:MAG: ATP synthase F1 subunit delta [Deltaproteobacteria bacterium]|jgi:F-type H+-transporting ATPase subunit delta|nr:ATP synthase F1 subunit delta [Deltaproteobacteria bacterium]
MISILSKRYAQALLDLGLEDGKYKLYGSEIKELANSLKALGPEANYLSSPLIPGELKEQMLQAILKKAAFSPLVNSFIRLLHDKGRFELLGEIAEAYQTLVDEKEGICRGTVTTAVKLSASHLAAIKEALGIYTGLKIELTEKVDPLIIGGIIANLGDLTLDSSIRSRVRKLAQAFSGD